MILLALFWLGVVMTVAFTVWRLLGNLRSLLASVRALGERLGPVLDELAAGGQQAAEHASRLSERGAQASREA